MTKKKLNSYKGKLSPAQIAEGINAAERNGKRLAEDARILLDAKRFPTAASLAILAIEEFGKTIILRWLAVAGEEKTVAACWRAYRIHTQKNIWALPLLRIKNVEDAYDFPYELDQVKQLGFYTDRLDNGHWVSPEKEIEEWLAEMYVQIATGFFPIDQEPRETRTEEIELWVKHIGPVWEEAKDSEMKKAMLDWYAELRDRGLDHYEDDRFERFLHLFFTVLGS